MLGKAQVWNITSFELVLTSMSITFNIHTCILLTFMTIPISAFPPHCSYHVFSRVYVGPVLLKYQLKTWFAMWSVCLFRILLQLEVKLVSSCISNISIECFVNVMCVTEVTYNLVQFYYRSVAAFMLGMFTGMHKWCQRSVTLSMDMEATNCSFTFSHTYFRWSQKRQQ